MSLRPIADVAADLGLGPDLAPPYGRWRARLSLDALDAPAGEPGRCIVVTAVTPTGAGEGKTVTSISLAMGLANRGRRSIATLRQSSLGPTLGLKGGGAGGGRAAVEPVVESLLGPGLELGAIDAANNLLAAAIDDAVHRGTSPLDPSTITWRRVLDVNDRSLRNIVSGLGGRPNGTPREAGFDITAASEVMAVLAMSRDLADLRARCGRIVVGFDREGAPVTADDLRAAGAMAVLLRDALRPTLMQTSDGTPALLHTGPFANIAFGNSSIVADRIALPRVEYLVTEAGFGSDLGAEKFCHIKCRASGISPSAAVVVTTVRAMKHHGGGDDLAAVDAGCANLRRHIGNMKRFGLPVVVAINRFPTDTAEELAVVRKHATAAGAHATAPHEGFTKGGEGAAELADAVIDACENGHAAFKPMHDENDDVETRVDRLAREIYGANEVEWEPKALRSLQRFRDAGFAKLPVCVAKTHKSLSHDPRLLGAPKDFTFPVRDIRLYAGAGYFTVLAGDILTMPGLPPAPRFQDVDLDADGNVVGLS